MGSSEKPVKEKKEKKEKRDKSEKKSKSKDRKPKTEVEEESTATPDADVPMLDAPAVEEALVKKEKKEKKEKKDKKAQKDSKEKESTPTTTDVDADHAFPSSSKKRKRSTDEPELEINLSAPEPPSKKALRKLKKAGIDPSTLPNKTPKKAGATLATAGAKITKVPADAASNPHGRPEATETQITFPTHASQSRSKHGIWIGNLSFLSTEQELRNFFVNNGGVPPDEITRINLPLNPTTKRNKGFAYVDFTTESALKSAIDLSESLLNTRRVLIKDAKDFSSRRNGPSTEPVAQAAAGLTKKPPSKILYCGNLEFEVTAEMLQNHFSFAGKIQKVRLATFQDSGKCKGFGFIDFEDIESVKRAMLGLSPEEEKIYQTVEGKEEVELFKKRRKRAILSGRPITMEFGEDPSTRYKKRFGKKEGEEGEERPERPRRRAEKGDGDEVEQGWEQRREKKMQKPDNRSADPGAAYSADSRRTGAITDGMAKGKKMTFD